MCARKRAGRAAYWFTIEPLRARYCGNRREFAAPRLVQPPWVLDYLLGGFGVHGG